MNIKRWQSKFDLFDDSIFLVNNRWLLPTPTLTAINNATIILIITTHTNLFSNVFLSPRRQNKKKQMENNCAIALNLEYIKNGIFMHFLTQYLRKKFYYLFSLALPKSNKDRASSEDRNQCPVLGNSQNSLKNKNIIIKKSSKYAKNNFIKFFFFFFYSL